MNLHFLFNWLIALTLTHSKVYSYKTNNPYNNEKEEQQLLLGNYSQWQDMTDKGQSIFKEATPRVD